MTHELERRDTTPAPAPVGTVTMLLTDVEGSTKLWEEHSDAMRAAIRRHHELAHEQIERHAGYRPPDQGEGDSVFAVFAEAPSGVACALDLQRALAAEPWPEEAELRVRMALHTGALELRDGRNYAGVALSRCARLRAIAHGGQTVLSQATRVLVGDDLPPDAGVKDLGTHRLKDLAAPEHVFQLTHAKLPAEFPALRSLDARPNNLPVQLTRFVGRERELAELDELLGETRLLTLTGTGGCGKTRLALQLAAQLVDRYPDGVWLAELFAVSDPTLVPRVLASAMVVRGQKGRAITDTLVERLAPQTALLLFDNCEHLVGACAELAERVLVACPGVAVLATSREPLAIPGETLWRVPSLTLPEPGADEGVDTLAGSESAQLFLDRAVAAEPSFVLTGDNAASVAAVCRRLEGIPLAIELAAAALRAFTLEEIERRLERQFRLLDAAGRTLARQQTLQATIDWSHDLLSEQERLLFRRLSVFAGGFALDAAEDVCAGGGIERDEVLGNLGQLVLKSLVLREADGRYRLLEVIREYAQAKLLEAREEDELRDHHLDWAVALAERAEPELRGADQQSWLDTLHADLDNFRAAFGWSLARPQQPEAALRLGSALRSFWIVRADWGEGRGWMVEALARPGDVDPAMRAKACLAAGELAYVLSDFPSAVRHFEEARDVARRIDPQTAAEALMWLASLADLAGRRAEAQELMEESVATFRALGDEPSLARSLGGLAWLVLGSNLQHARRLQEETLAIRRRLGNLEGVGWALIRVGFCARTEGDYAGAHAAYDEALSLARDIGYKRMIARCLTQLADLALAEDDLVGARAALDESLPLWRDTGHQTGLADGLRALGDLSRLDGDEGAAAEFLEESLKISRDIGWPDAEAAALDSLAALARARGYLDEAQTLDEEALSIWRKMEDTGGEALAVHRLGLLAADRGLLEDAARLLGEAESLRDRLGAALSPSERAELERVVAAGRTALGAEAFAAAWEARRGER